MKDIAGAATRAAQLGVPEAIIKAMGKWENSAYLLYVLPRETLAGISQAISGC